MENPLQAPPTPAWVSMLHSHCSLERNEGNGRLTSLSAMYGLQIRYTPLNYEVISHFKGVVCNIQFNLEFLYWEKLKIIAINTLVRVYKLKNKSYFDFLLIEWFLLT